MSKAIIEKIEEIISDPSMDYEKLKKENERTTNDPRKLARASAYHVCVHVTDNFSYNPDATIEEMKRIIEVDSVDYDGLAGRIVEKFKPTD